VSDLEPLDTRHVWSDPCEDGHAASIFDLVLNGHTYLEALAVHANPDHDQHDLYIQPTALREYIEGDHDLLHRVGRAVGQAWLDRVGGSDD
jgi:hypothetical protein